MFKKFFAIVAFVSCSYCVAVGEGVKSDSSGTYYLDEIVVTATRVERSVKDLSATVSVVTEEEIEASNIKSCTDILSSLPGLFVNKTGDFGRASGPGTRWTSHGDGLGESWPFPPRASM